MDTSNSGRQIRAWAAVGAMTSRAIFDRFDQNILDSPPFSAEELNALQTIFEEICDDNNHLHKEAFKSLVIAKGELPPVLREAAGILFDGLCYLSTTPLQASSPPPNFLTLEGLKRALVWSFPQKASSIITNTSGYRERSPADHRRLIFQGLATSYQAQCLPVNSQMAKALAAANARNFPPGYRGGSVGDEDVNYDDDGDEMYHDVLDFLASTRPYVPPSYADPRRDSYRDLATKLHSGAPSLYKLAVATPRMQAFLSLLLAINLRNGVADCRTGSNMEFQNASQSMVACFNQTLENSELSHEITWPMFNFAISKLLPHLFESLYSLLSLVFFDEPCRFDANTGYTKPSVILTLPRMVQVETFLYNSISMIDIHRHQIRNTANELIEAIENMSEYALLLISGHTVTNEAYVYGAFIALPQIDEPFIQDDGSNFDETAVLFQLSPTHDVFRGNIGAAAWQLNKDGLVIGNKDHGAALAIDTSLKKAQFTHRLPCAGAKAVYSPTVHRGDFQTLLLVDAVDLWGKLP